MTDDQSLAIDGALAALRADAADTRAFLRALAVRFEGALSGRVTVERHGSLFNRGHDVKQIGFDTGPYRFAIADAGHGRLVAERTHVVRGIALKTEQLEIDGWLTALATELATLARSSAESRQALERLLLGHDLP